MQQRVFLMTYEESVLLFIYEITLDWICFRVMDAFVLFLLICFGEIVTGPF